MVITEKFTQKNGFRFPKSKISMLHFMKLSSPPLIELQLGNIRTQKSETVEYLVSVFDSKLDWKPHIQQFKSKCLCNTLPEASEGLTSNPYVL